MSVAEPPPAVRLRPVEQSLCGWGRTSSSRARVYRSRGEEEVLEAIAAEAGRGGGLIARGAGCSYGDAAQNAGGAVLDTSAMDAVGEIDPVGRTVTAQAGATIAQLLVRLAAHGLTLPVLPGTRHVTLAGAIASDIHGKNHHRDGALARHVLALRLCAPGRGAVTLTPEQEPELLYATLGGMGLTGVVVEATLRADVLPSPWVAADIDRTDGLLQTLELLGGEERRRFSVAWLDLLAPGSRCGRAVISRADPLEAEAPEPHSGGRRRARTYPEQLLSPPLAQVPDACPRWLLRTGGVRAFNEAYWRRSPRSVRGRPEAIAPYFFPLDVLGSWNRLYGPTGLVQYQFVIPAGREDALERSFALMRARRLPVFLAVFKRFGPEFGGPLSFPLEGWTLAVDVPARAPGLAATLGELDELVAGCGGRVYLSKDSRMRPETVAAMYPRLDAFREQCDRADPDGVLGSDLSRRLRLRGEGV
jgi:decaprenylphospho-beta-D-ribofuranose 2-oxidase